MTVEASPTSSPRSESFSDDAPFYHLVPKGLVENAEFRRDLIEWGCESPEAARLLWIMCKRDLLFFINSFCFIFEPRPSEDFPFSEIPFITWEFQDRALLQMAKALGKRDIGIAKSRDQGATWISLVLLFWQWCFYDGRSFLLVSRNADLVDASNDTDTLMAKLDQMWNMLPGFLRPPRERTHMTMVNKHTRSHFNGETTTGNAGRGGRRAAVLLDELGAFDVGESFAAWKSLQYVADTLIWPSTPNGKTGAFFEAWHKPDAPTLKLRMHWSQHDRQRRGLYGSANGQAKFYCPSCYRNEVAITPDLRLSECPDCRLQGKHATYQYEEGYRFRLDSKLRSPYYDRQCARATSEREIAQELDIDFGGSDSAFFDGAWLTTYEAETCRPPVNMMHLKDFLKGKHLGLTPLAWERIESTGAMVNLWINRDGYGRVPNNCLYFMGVDVAAGVGASGSAIEIIEGRTGQKVLEFVCERIYPEELAEVAVAICSMFEGHDGQGAKMIWEARGPGATFGAKVVEHGYLNVYFVQNEQSLSKKMTDTPGWNPTPDNQRKLLESWREGLTTGKAVDLSSQSVNEARQYIFTPDGSVKHSSAVRNLDASANKKNHGDRVMASALAWWICRQLMQFVDPLEEHYAAGTHGWLEQQDEKARLAEEEKKRRPAYRYGRADLGDYRYGGSSNYHYAGAGR